MHLGFKEEFKELLGEWYYGKGGLPKVLIEMKYIGGVEEIQKLHDDKKLEKLLDCCERINDIEGGDGGCEACGDIKFVIMKKMIIVRFVGECGFQRCSHCNENGLIRCFMCCF
ncbi:putative thioredoxin-like protein [Medicago truncatula]|uniref:Putative thioredoxin-like protein n=1 Tax=Medicago truncatula TaxID=3880 RepID=A0A396H118_MEDTR|nr:putative thioredoxin-like protein [Medicago truncatula]